MSLPKRGPRARKFGLTVQLASSPSSVTNSSSRTLSSARTISARPSIVRRSASVATITALASGWRIFTFAWARAARPSSTARRAASTPASSSGSRSESVGLGIVLEVHGSPRSRRLGAVDEVEPDRVGGERDERREQLRGLDAGSGGASRTRPRRPPRSGGARPARTSSTSRRRSAAIALPALVESKSSSALADHPRSSPAGARRASGRAAASAGARLAAGRPARSAAFA